MAHRFSWRAKGILIALVVIACPAAYTALACDLGSQQSVVADGGPTDKGKSDKDCRKRPNGERTSSEKPCPDGGERLPQDRRHSPLDSLPPLAPLVA